MSNRVEVLSTMVPPRVKAPPQADRLGRLAAAGLVGMGWATARLLRGLRWLDGWLGRRQRGKAHG